MTTQIVCLLIGALLPCLWAGVTGRYRKRQFGNIGLYIVITFSILVQGLTIGKVIARTKAA